MTEFLFNCIPTLRHPLLLRLLLLLLLRRRRLQQQQQQQQHLELSHTCQVRSPSGIPVPPALRYSLQDSLAYGLVIPLRVPPGRSLRGVRAWVCHP